MTEQEDIRWEQGFSSFNKALKKLSEAIEYMTKELKGKEAANDDVDVMEDILKEGLIQHFEYTNEMAWNVMKYYALYQGFSEMQVQETL